MTSNKLLPFNKPVISVPEEMLYYNKKGKAVHIKTLTKTGNISKREKKQAIRFETNKDNQINSNFTFGVKVPNKNNVNFNYSQNGIKNAIKYELRNKVMDEFGRPIDKWSKKYHLNRNKK